METPCLTTICDCATGEPVECRITPLPSELAKEKIDDTWWRGFDDNNGEEDYGWNWAQKCQRRLYSKKFGVHALRTPDHAVQAALIYEINVVAPLCERRAVFLHNLSSAPANRKKLVGDKRKYKGCGSAMVAFASAESWSLGLGGVLSAFPLPGSVDFYIALGFQKTDVVDKSKELYLYELPTEAAAELLAKHRFFQ